MCCGGEDEEFFFLFRFIFSFSLRQKTHVEEEERFSLFPFLFSLFSFLRERALRVGVLFSFLFLFFVSFFCLSISRERTHGRSWSHHH